MATRKRPRQQQIEQRGAQPSHSSKAQKFKEDEETIPSSLKTPSLLTPHTQRLLKLIQEGTASHARHAALHLREIAARSSPLVLWDLLGRLQALLIGDAETTDGSDASSNWSCRQHAQWAMQGVAQCLPKIDQDDFLTNSTISTEWQTSPEAAADATHLWLTVQDLDMNMVLQKGRLLLAAPEHKYDEDALRLQRLDEQSESVDDFVQRRIQLQRRILAKRLGLGGIVQATGNADEWLPDTLTSQDYLAPSIPTDEKSKSAGFSGSASNKKQPPKQTNTTKTSVRALLMIEMRQQTSNTATGGSSSAVSHQNPQQLLATELLYRMFDPHWHVRHGALLGISSLLQAWHNSRSKTNDVNTATVSSFGAWPQDLLARSLCVLALDRFADFSGDATVAPVRLASAQAVAWLYHLAPADVQASCRLRVVQLARHFGDDWEVRHGGLVAIQFLLVVVVNKKDLEEFGRIAMQALSDECDDVVAVAAQVLLSLLKRQSGTVDTSYYMGALWSALVKIESAVSSSAVPLVTLFSESVSRHVDHLPVTIEEVWRKMIRFLDYSSSSIQICTMEALASMVCESCVQGTWPKSTLDAYHALVLRIFDSFSEQFQYIENVTTLKRLERARRVVWKALVAIAPLILTSIEKQRPLLMDIILRLVGLEQLHQEASVRRSESVSRSQRSIVCRCVAELLSSFASTKILIETTILSLLSSPWIHHCEVACLLYRYLCQETSDSVIACRSEFRIYLEDTLPPCVVADGTPLVDDAEAMHNFDTAFVTNLNRGASMCEPSAAIIEDMKAVVKKMLPQEVPGSSKPTAARMRISALIAGAIVADENLPAKLTPLIRALMTSLKSDVDPEYVDFTCIDLVALLQLLEGNAQVRNKLLSNICNLSNGMSASKFAAVRIVEKLVHELKESATLQALPPIVLRLSPLQSLDPSTAETKSLREALDLTLVVARAVTRGSAATVHLIESTIQALVLVACISPDLSNRKAADACVKALSRADSTSMLDKSIPLLARHLQDKSNDTFRVGACKLLHGIIEEVDMEVCPFVRYLLPIAMSLMTDPVVDCAKAASRAFADLVRVAPLVREVAEVAWSLDMDDHSKSVMDHLIHGKPLPPCEIPCYIAGEMRNTGLTLRGYQAEGVAWLRFLQTVKLNGALCDDMGLGKTIQALVAISLSHHDSKSQTVTPKSLVVCPASVVGHWVSEIRKFFPNLFTPLAIVGNAKQRSKSWADNLGEANLVVTSYSVLRSDIGRLKQPRWEYCILDEGHLLKNPQTATAMAARLLRSHHRLILTGTPVQNRVNELWATFDFLMPNFLGSHSHFSKMYGNPIGQGQQPGSSAHIIKAGMDKLKLLHQQVLPFILRREKDQVLKELPPKCITDIPCSLTSEQSSLYTSFCHGSGVKKSIAALQSMLSSDESEQVQLGSNVLKTLLYLRLLCTHPLLIEKRASPIDENEAPTQLQRSGKLKALNDLLRTAGVVPDDLAAADNDASMFYVDTDEETSGDNFSASLQDSSDSPLVAVPSLTPQTNTKCLIFAQFMHSLDIVEKYLFKTHMPSLRYLRLDGSVPNERRTAIVNAFNEDESIQVLLLTCRVGGLGLNLTGASTVIFLENDYNPFADLQAMDRAHRIGQRKAVNVYRLVTTDTIEEKIMVIQQAKVRMSNAIVNSENSSMYSMGTDRLLDIFTFQSSDSGTKDDSSAKTSDVALDDLLDDEEEYHSLSVEEFVKGFSMGSGNNELS